MSLKTMQVLNNSSDIVKLKWFKNNYVKYGFAENIS